MEYSGEDDFDQINVLAIPGGTNNQNGRFEFLDDRTAAPAARAWGSPTWRWACSATMPSSASAPSPSGGRSRPTSSSRTRGGRPATLHSKAAFRWVFWPPWYSTTNNIANFDRAVLRSGAGGDHQPVERPARSAGIATTASCCRATDSKARATTWSSRGIPRVQALFRGEPRGFSDMHYNVIEPRVGVAYSLNDKTTVRASAGVFHNRTTLNDSTILGGNPPFQPMVDRGRTASRTIRAAERAARRTCRSRMQAQDVAFKHPTSYMWAVGVGREDPLRLRPGCDLRRTARPVPAA